MNGYRSYLRCRPVDSVDAKEKCAKKQGCQRVQSDILCAVVLLKFDWTFSFARYQFFEIRSQHPECCLDGKGLPGTET
jgi:hypothetical protein